MSTNVRGDKTRSQVLDAAWDLISEKGADVSVSDIAVSAGISRQTIYLHFGSRGGLLVALVRRADERFEIKKQFDVALSLQQPKDRIVRTLQAWLAFVPKIYPVAKDLIRLRDTDADAATAWADRMDELREWLLDLMRSLQRDGALRDEWSPEHASQFFWVQTSVQAWGLLRKDCDWSEEAIATHLELVLTQSLLRDGTGD
ncbi:TetR/AcrR family transcriptional regulator [Tateyamaria omphalii]|uniref:TetR/AcrR family transcriptional regulator n=1 Tax=Tateyamaria omphalii TaxID=299262 RepID=UPI001C99B04D|nr:TetR/AcrR family transcriptional regulator [Tateyamaria omphalii]MBY5934751.1 TetR/AcrR family transcriptional regulator [Tateyamaria omphalii]